MLLENYLEKHDKNIEDVSSQVAYSQRQLNNLAVILYPDKVLEVIADVVEKNLITVLYELLILEDPGKVSDIGSREELASAVKNQQAYVYIKDPVRTENSRLVNSVLSEKDTLGLELGSKGGVNLLGEIIYQFQKMFDSEDREFKDLKNKLRHYRVRIHDDGGSILYKREEAY